jgi:NAD(P) transhydrogenase
MKKFDFIVLGSGPAGRRAAIQAAKFGLTVLVIDDRSKVGGVSVHTGTIPSKTMRETVMNLSGWRERGIYGRSFRARQTISPADLAARMDVTLQHEIAVLEHQFARNNVSTCTGKAKFLSPRQLIVERNIDGCTVNELCEGGKILIAVGTAPFRPEGIPFNDESVVDSDDFVLNPRIPRSLTVVGGGVIGVEYATIFSALDIPVTLIDSRQRILEFLDREVIDHLMHLMRDRGITLRLNADVKAIEFTNDGRPVAILADGRHSVSDMILYTAGRIGATGTLDLAAAGLEADDRGRLSVDRTTYQTSQSHIYAAGDVIGFPSLASTSMEQGRAAACHAFGHNPSQAGHLPPFGVYSVPELSCVGISEEEAREAGISYECGIARFRETSRGHIMGMDNGILKVICERTTRRLLGVHIVGEGAAELVHLGQTVINLGGTIDYFVDGTFNYPTLAEAYKIAALEIWNRLAIPSASGPAECAPAKRAA